MEKERNQMLTAVIIAVILSTAAGSAGGYIAGLAAANGGAAGLIERLSAGRIEAGNPSNGGARSVVTVEEESAVITAVEKVSPAVVSIIVTKDLPIIERYYSDPFGNDDFFRRFFGDDFDGFFGVPQYRQRGTERREIGGGSGFLVSPDGYILTNKHVVIDEEADYTVLMNDETKHAAAVLARDPLNDLAVLKIEGRNLPYVELGDSSNLKVGQNVIAIGNALGEFRNTVSTGVISGLSRSVVAGGTGIGSEQLLGVIQTDASINPGNSGGPLLNIAGQVIGINTAMAVGAENIGFAIPVNEIKNAYQSVKATGRIVRPWLGVRYVLVNEAVREENRLEVDYGALIVRGETMTELAVMPGSPADKAGLREGDIILEMDGTRVDEDNPLARLISRRQPGEEVELLVLSQGREKTVRVELEEMK